MRKFRVNHGIHATSFRLGFAKLSPNLTLCGNILQAPFPKFETTAVAQGWDFSTVFRASFFIYVYTIRFVVFDISMCCTLLEPHPSALQAIISFRSFSSLNINPLPSRNHIRIAKKIRAIFLYLLSSCSKSHPLVAFRPRVSPRLRPKFIDGNILKKFPFHSI